MRNLLVPLALLGACHPTPDSSDEPAQSCTEGDRRTGLLTTLKFTRPDDQGRIEGFDLDGATTTSGDASGCGRADDTSPAGVTGVDASFNALLPALELTEGAALEEIIQTLINNGEVLILWDVHGLDDPQQDECVTLDVLRGDGQPIIGGLGRINPGQTFDRRSDDVPVHVDDVAITDGSFTASGFPFEIPFSFLDANIHVTLQDLSLRVDLHDDGTFTGVMGGGIVVEDLLTQLDTTGVASEVKALARSAMTAGADLAPDASGSCTEMSAAIGFEGVSAFLFDTPPMDTGVDTDAP